MRALVISDVHGNLAALEAVLRERHDLLICLGDIVGYGPEPAACIERIRSAGAVAIRGNHDATFADGLEPGCRPAFLRLAQAAERVTRPELSDADVGYLAALPSIHRMEIDGARTLLVHATPSDPLHRYLGPDVEAWRQEVATVEEDLVLVGHTHLQFNIKAGVPRIVNPGSVGQPKDGEPTAAYAVIDRGSVELRRIRYRVEATIEAMAARGYPPLVEADLAALLRHGSVPAHLR